MSDRQQRFAELIKARRLELDLLQGQVAEACGVRQPAVSAWEAGTAYPTIDKLDLLAKVLEVDVADLLNPEPAGAGSGNGKTAEPVPAAATAGSAEPPGDGRHTAQETALSGGPLFGPEAKSHA
jgi:transcriptional regulator with XRE-family HTH domain